MSVGQRARRRAPKKRRWPYLLLVLLVLGGYVWYSAAQWSRVQEQTSSWAVQSRSELDRVSEEIRQPAETRDSRIAPMRKELARITRTGDASCTPHKAVRWQTRLGVGKDRLRACRKSAKQINTVAADLDLVAQYLQDERAAATVLERMAGRDNKVAEKKWKSTVKGWRAVRSDLKDLDVSEQFAPTRDDLVKSVGAVITAWKDLISAHQAKNFDAFDTSQQKLDATYKKLANVSDISAVRLAALDRDFVTAYKATYSDSEPSGQ